MGLTSRHIARTPWRVRLAAAAIVSVAVFGLCPSADATTTVVATAPGDGPIRAYGNIAAWIDYDPQTKSHVLVASIGGQVQTVPVAPQPQRAPLYGWSDFDLGPGPDGSTWAVYPRCQRANRCRLFRYSFGSNTEQPLPGTRWGALETEPSIWKGTVAFARRIPSRQRELTRTLIYTRSSITGRHTRQQSGLTKRLCTRRARGRCRPIVTAGSPLEDLELHEHQIAVITNFTHLGRPPFYQEVILLGTVDGRSRQVAGHWKASPFDRDTRFGGLGFDRGALFFTMDQINQDEDGPRECSSWYSYWQRIVSYRKGQGYRSARPPSDIEILSTFAKSPGGYFAVAYNPKRYSEREVIVMSDDPRMRRTAAPFEPRSRVFPERCGGGSGP